MELMNKYYTIAQTMAAAYCKFSPTPLHPYIPAARWFNKDVGMDGKGRLQNCV